MKKLSSLLVLAVSFVAVSCASTTHPKKAIPAYFPAGVVNDFEQGWFGSDLSAMKEPVLSAAAKPSGYFALRILLLPTWGPPVAVRYETDGTHGIYRSVMLSGQGGYDPGKFKAGRTVPLTQSEIAALRLLLDQSDYWSLPQKVDVMGMDGDELVMETIQNGEHRVLVRWTPSDNARERKLERLVSFYTPEFKKAGFWPQPNE